MITINKFLIIASLFTTSIISIPLDHSLSGLSNDNQVHISKKLIPGLENLNASEVSSDSNLHTKEHNKDIAPPFGSIFSLISKVSTKEGQNELLNSIEGKFNDFVDQSVGQVLSDIKTEVDSAVPGFTKEAKEVTDGFEALTQMGKSFGLW